MTGNQYHSAKIVLYVRVCAIDIAEGEPIKIEGTYGRYNSYKTTQVVCWKQFRDELIKLNF